ncbi:MAG: hypothetical protein ASARMPRED_005627 [Alectoria sarmentosa]|nr:MAG: hypothetical protein ASARMPRED_005627 [Alectoria sarmentosa]
MSSSRAKADMNPSSHLKSTQQELKESVVDGAGRVARGDSTKSTAQAMKEKNIEKGSDKARDAVRLDAGLAQQTQPYGNRQDTLSMAQTLLSDAPSAFTGLTWAAPGFVDETT